jgi:hypothetical protein
MPQPVIVARAHTPIGKLLGALSPAVGPGAGRDRHRCRAGTGRDHWQSGGRGGPRQRHPGWRRSEPGPAQRGGRRRPPSRSTSCACPAWPRSPSLPRKFPLAQSAFGIPPVSERLLRASCRTEVIFRHAMRAISVPTATKDKGARPGTGDPAANRPDGATRPHPAGCEPRCHGSQRRTAQWRDHAAQRQRGSARGSQRGRRGRGRFSSS